MFARFDIPRLSNDMKISVQKNHLGGQILYRRLDPKTGRLSSLYNRSHTSRRPRNIL